MVDGGLGFLGDIASHGLVVGSGLNGAGSLEDLILEGSLGLLDLVLSSLLGGFLVGLLSSLLNNMLLVLLIFLIIVNAGGFVKSRARALPKFHLLHLFLHLFNLSVDPSLR